MAGIDNITSEILQEATNQAEKFLSEAQAHAAALKAEADVECEKVIQDAAVKAEAEAKAYAARIESQIGMKRRQAVLSTKQELIEQVITAAKDKLAGQDAASYFAMIGKLLRKTAGAGEGEILFGAADKQRLPADFAEIVAKIAAEKGGSLTISDETADITDGFILRCGGIEENCTLSALFAEKRDLLQDKVASKLW